MPAIVSLWLRRNWIQRSSAPGRGRCRGKYLDTVRSETSMPSMRNSPWMRGAPQVEFSAAMRRIKSLRSLLMVGRPFRARRESQVQYLRKPVRCHWTTVSGFTKASVSDHLEHHRLSTRLRKYGDVSRVALTDAMRHDVSRRRDAPSESIRHRAFGRRA